jgi:hypothetical protein
MMKHNRQLVGPLRVISVLMIALWISGCRHQLGPERMPTARVTGVATEGGRPLSRGWVEFMPVDGTVGKLRSARLRRDGSFQADGVAVGLNLVRFVNADIENPAAEQLFGAFYSPIRRLIPAHPGPALTIDVQEEAFRWRDPRRRQANAKAPGPGAAR